MGSPNNEAVFMCTMLIILFFALSVIFIVQFFNKSKAASNVKGVPQSKVDRILKDRDKYYGLWVQATERITYLESKVLPQKGANVEVRELGVEEVPKDDSG